MILLLIIIIYTHTHSSRLVWALLAKQKLMCSPAIRRSGGGKRGTGAWGIMRVHVTDGIGTPDLQPQTLSKFAFRI